MAGTVADATVASGEMVTLQHPALSLSLGFVPITDRASGETIIDVYSLAPAWRSEVGGEFSAPPGTRLYWARYLTTSQSFGGEQQVVKVQHRTISISASIPLLRPVAGTEGPKLLMVAAASEEDRFLVILPPECCVTCSDGMRMCGGTVSGSCGNCPGNQT